MNVVTESKHASAGGRYRSRIDGTPIEYFEPARYA